jgi:hypothetical protein
MNKKEKILLELHIDYYKNSNTKFLNISEFIAYLDITGFIPNEEFLKVLLKELGCKIDGNIFIKKYKKERGEKSLSYSNKVKFVRRIKH